MRSKIASVVLSLLIAFLVFANMEVKEASAHNWWLYHWNRTGVTIGVWNYATRFAEAEAALNDWDANTTVQWARRNFHTDISVFDGNFGATGWWGLATIESTSYGWWECWTWCHITHAHTIYNSFYGGSGGTGSGSDIRGVFCQEIGHNLGFDHSNTGDCMGKGYYNNINTLGSHNTSDMNKYFSGGTHP
jgi:hypothetical protein